MTREPRNTAASVRVRLLSLAQSIGEDYQRVLGIYAVERFLYRLGRSPYRDKFTLKGTTLFTLWMGHTPGPQRIWTYSGAAHLLPSRKLKRLFGRSARFRTKTALCSTASVEGARIKEDDEYDGVRIKLLAELAGARIPLQIDIGFGDAVYPEPKLASFPVLLPMEEPLIRAYPRESVIAEEFHAMVVLDIRNSRMKDFYDIWLWRTPGHSTWHPCATRSLLLLKARINSSNWNPICPNRGLPERSAEEAAMGCLREPTGLRRHDSVS